jgi:uncharacterized protein YkwD
MGRAVIVSGGTAGYYTITAELARENIEAELAAIAAELETLAETEAEQQEAMDFKQLEVDEIKMAIDALIDRIEEHNVPAGTEGLVAAHNLIRSANGLGALSASPALTTAAEQHSDWMRDTDNVGHTGSGGTTPRQRALAAGYTGVLVGENVAAGQHSVQIVMQAWMNSPGHRAAILNPEYDEIGVGYAFCNGPVYWHFWTVMFGKAA